VDVKGGLGGWGVSGGVGVTISVNRISSILQKLKFW